MRTMMLGILAALAVATTPMGDRSVAKAQGASLTDPQPMPVVTMETLAGDPRTLGDYSGEVLVLNLFATWCAPCKAEMPLLDNLQAKVEGMPVQVVALSIDRVSSEKIRGWMDDIGVQHLTTLRDPTRAATRILGAPGLPATYIIDTKGRQRAKVYGVEEWDDDRIVQMLQSLVDEAA